tara:strand:+ start:364 stop:642 length:279 start_codon:yes stop_codon:yes gene_type:complete
MKFNLQGFIDVFTWEVAWLDANFFWVFLSVIIYIALFISIFIFLLLIINKVTIFLEVFKETLFEKKLRWVYYLLVFIFWFYAIVLPLEYFYE